MTAKKGLTCRRAKILFTAILVGILLSANVQAGSFKRKSKKPLSSITLRSMARVYMATGHYNKAQGLAEQALSVARKTNADDEELSMCLIDLAYLYHAQGKCSEAEQMCSLGLKLQEKIYFENYAKFIFHAN